jgi:hypothetical protein
MPVTDATFRESLCDPDHISNEENRSFFPRHEPAFRGPAVARIVARGTGSRLSRQQRGESMDSMHERESAGNPGRATIGTVMKLVTVIVAAFVFAAFSSTPAQPQSAQCSVAPDMPRVDELKVMPQAGAAAELGNASCIKAFP